MTSKNHPVAMITGGTRGIGSGIAEMFAEEGYDLILGFREDINAAEKFKTQLLQKYEDQNLKIELIQGSILDDKIITSYFEAVDKNFDGNLNVLVHNASQIYVPKGDTRHPYEIGRPGNSNYGNLLQTCTDSEGKSSVEEEFVDFTLIEHYSNLYSKCLINFAERAVKRMKDDNGSIIFISSPGCNITQTVTKGYDMPGFGKSSGEFAIRYYAKNLQPRGINANSIIPGVVNTGAWNGYLTTMGPKLGLKTREEMMNFMIKRCGQKRVLEPYEIGKVATFLCQGGRCITGMSINADGGIHLG